MRPHRLTMTRRVSVLAAAVAFAACAPAAPDEASAPEAPPDTIALQVAPLPLSLADPSLDTIGAFRYAGGLAISSDSTADLHGLSAIVVGDEGRLTSVGDLGVLFRARIVLDESGRLVGLDDGRLSRLLGEDGQPLFDKPQADAEGLAIFPGGDALVSFEREHRILRYPADGTLPSPVPSPAAAFPPNGGMEGLTVDPDRPGEYLVGAEESGETWTCRFDGGCEAGPAVPMPPGFGLTAIARVPGHGLAYLLRAYDPEQGNRIAVVIASEKGPVDRLEFARPLLVDNFEGLAAVARPDGAIRFYLLSDDNASPTQRTLLLAFDWRP